MREPEKQLGVRISASLYNEAQDFANKQGMTFKECVTRAISQFVHDSKERNINKSSDPWCCVVDMGSFDLIMLESDHFQTCESYRVMVQPLVKLTVEIKLRSTIRELTEDWMKVELCSGISVEEPKTGTQTDSI